MRGRVQTLYFRWFHERGWRSLVIGVPYIWLVAFFFLPFLIVLSMSFAWSVGASPPFEYRPPNYVNGANYIRLIDDTLYIRAFLISIYNAGIATILCVMIGYPMALALTRVSATTRNIMLMLVILPFWTSFILRIYAWMGLFSPNSWFNKFITQIYNSLAPEEWAVRFVPMMHSNFAVILVMVYSYLPFMILPLYANLERLDFTLNEAAMDLGSRPWQVFKDITLPMSVPGIIAGGLLVFIPALGELVIPSLVGNAANPVIGRVISDEFSTARNWPMASALSVVLLILMVFPTMLYTHFEAKAQRTGTGS